MDNSNYNTEHKKYQHLTTEERHVIEVRLNIDKWSIYAIAKSLGRPYNTIKNEIDRGTVLLYNGKVARYKADKGEEVYLEHRKNDADFYFCNVHHREKCLIRVIFSNSICRKSRRKSRLFPPQKTLLNFLFR